MYLPDTVLEYSSHLVIILFSLLAPLAGLKGMEGAGSDLSLPSLHQSARI